MGTGSKTITILFLLLYAYLVFLVFTQPMKMMLAMQVMAVGMFLQAGIDCWCAFRKTK
ncbi:hypothetical protein [Furfurilactobacillus siliginis]|uniref:Uncharacterized protein n=1 Tax=Furfurilactobacillus siliginis TaxID=348151 RepID=A0A0R2L4Y4_9LACO|nr:hypothetical protein [Furfurilactobacillus siliginis]KRN96626.1 hypothetical protein IV55_GL001150 [Furfurilactobacillus siliginis]GEK29388.1 hypothetical protein LSI01_16990 [Furfurilactobacillus siliginis]